MKIAIIGSGIAGLTSAYLLQREHEITVFEAQDWIGGHTHTGAHTLVRNGVADQIAHAVRIGAFKKYDEYADALGLPDESLGPAILFVVDPMSDHPVGWITPFYDLDAGLEYLAWKRSKA